MYNITLLTKANRFMDVVFIEISELFQVNLRQLYPCLNYLHYRKCYCYRLLRLLKC